MVITLLRASWSALMVLICLFHAGYTASAQIPTQCLEIESILVDACNPNSLCGSSTEGENEMVRFKVGPDPIALSDIEVNWPNNNFLGIVQNSTTASNTAALNATIQSCGLLVEPVGGVIPAGSTVLLITSTSFCIAGNSFALLSDTIQVIFQEAGNTAGHFANSPASGQVISPTPPPGTSLRTLTISVVSAGCSDEVTYVRESLVNTLGSYGGQSGEMDGGTVLFTWPDEPTATYVNFGCQAPFIPLQVTGTADGALCGGVGTVNLDGMVSGGAFNSVQWSGGTGTFGDPNAMITTYTAGPGDTGNVDLLFCAITDCANPTCTLVTIPAGAGPTITIAADGPLALCLGEDVVLTANGADSYAWSTAANTPAITVNAPGIYTVVGTNACGVDSASVEVTTATGVTVTVTGDTEVCPGDTAFITASGASTYEWSTGETTPTIAVNLPGNYFVTGTSSCGTGQGFFNVMFGTAPTVEILGDTVLCGSETTTLTAVGANTYVWSIGETTDAITVDAAGTYTVVGTNGCGSGQAAVEVTSVAAPVVSIAGATSICAGDATILTATGADDYEWSTGETTASITVSEAGTYTVTGTGGCGESEASATVVVASGPTLAIEGGTVLCQGESTQLTASGATSYVWSTGETGATIAVESPGIYTVFGTDSCGTDSISVEVMVGLLPTVSVSGPGVFCPGESVELTATSNDPITWSTGEAGATITVDGTGTYTATATNACGTSQAAITVQEVAINSDFTADPTSGTAPLNVVFTNTSIPPDANYVWDLGDGTNSSLQDPQHIYTEAGTYVVTLTVTANGCTANSSGEIVVFPAVAPPLEESGIIVPNIITPNGDRMNDVLLLTTTNILRLEMQIFNRWGQKVNELMRVGETWDARTFAGLTVPDGTYFYVIEAEGGDGKQFNLTGHLTVVR